MKTRTDVINYLIEKNGYEEYLEIGVCNPAKNFNKIDCRNKTGVDPNKQTDYRMTSDKFFEQLSKNYMYDIIFVDGMHLYDYVLRDINNSLKHLNPKGVIVVHDCNPKKKNLVRPYEEYNGGPWCGTVWQAIAHLRMKRGDLQICVVDIDYGCGIIKKGQQEVFKPFPVGHIPIMEDILIYDFLVEHREELLNVCSVEEFKEDYA